MIIGIGTDIVKVARMEQALARHGERFARRILAETELEEFRTRQRPAAFLAKRFAVKEALAKALGTGIRNGITLRQISVDHDQLGAPILVLSGEAERVAIAKGTRHRHLSLSDEEDYVVAFVVLSG